MIWMILTVKRKPAKFKIDPTCNLRDGYCQAQAPVAALLLMNMPEEEAFWTLVSVCERYIPGKISLRLVCIISFRFCLRF